MNRGRRQPERGVSLGPLDLLVLSAWCGLAAGELEVAARIVPRAVGLTHRLYMMTRHFVWLVPLVNLVLFLGCGVCWSGDATLALSGGMAEARG